MGRRNRERRKFKLQDITLLLEKAIRKEAKSRFPGRRKMKRVIDDVAKVLDALIILPPLLETFDGPAIRFLLHIIAEDVFERIKHELSDDQDT